MSDFDECFVTEWVLTPFLSVSRATVSLKARLAARLSSLLYIAEYSNLFNLWWVREQFHHLKDIGIAKTAVSKSRIPQNELIRDFDKSPTKYKLIGMFQAFFNFFTLHTKQQFTQI